MYKPPSERPLPNQSAVVLTAFKFQCPSVEVVVADSSDEEKPVNTFALPATTPKLSFKWEKKNP